MTSYIAAGAGVTVISCQFRQPHEHAMRLSRRANGFSNESGPGVSRTGSLIWTQLTSQACYRKTSAYNEAEARAAVTALRSMIKPNRTIGVAAYYAAQVELLQRLLDEEYGAGSHVVHTVSQLQGAEFNSLLLLTTCPEPTPFTADPRGAVVALSRHRHDLHVICSEAWLLSTPAGRSVAERIPELEVPPP
eukprot:6036327-Amphidinium_carterae.1